MSTRIIELSREMFDHPTPSAQIAAPNEEDIFRTHEIVVVQQAGDKNRQYRAEVFVTGPMGENRKQCMGLLRCSY